MTEPYVRPDVRAFLDYLNAQPGPRVHQVSPAEGRELARATRALVEVDMGELGVIPRPFAAPLPTAAASRSACSTRARRGRRAGAGVFHGGGFVVGDLDIYAPLCAELARFLDLPVVSVDYRLAPEHPWPAAPTTCAAAARWIASGPAELGRGVSALVLAGDSAGGTLAIVTALALRDAPAEAPVIAQWPVYPAVDLGTAYASQDAFADGYFLTRDAMVWFGEQYRADPASWRAAPLHADQAGLPPTLVLTASLDPLVDHGRAYAAATIRAGVPTIYREAVGTIHGFLNMRRAIPSAQGDLAACLGVLKAMIVEAEANRTMAQAAPAPPASPARLPQA
jgi:acetyl esterase